MIGKHALIMQLEDADEQSALFSQPMLGEPGEIVSTMKLDANVWREMDEPHTITVTIEPGDLLNAQA